MGPKDILRTAALSMIEPRREHQPDCFVFVYARALIGVNRRGMCTCGASGEPCTLPKHAGSCSNQNVMDPLGAYKGVTECGCNRAAPTGTTEKTYLTPNSVQS